MRSPKAISTTLILIMSCLITAQSQDVVVAPTKHHLNISAFAFRSVTAFPGSTAFYSISTWYDYKLPLLNNQISIGPNFNYASDLSNTDYHIGFRGNYALINTEKTNLFVGGGLGYGKRTLWNKSTEDGMRTKWQIGLRFIIRRNISGLVEWSNYRFQGGSFPTIGLSYSYRNL